MPSWSPEDAGSVPPTHGGQPLAVMLPIVKAHAYGNDFILAARTRRETLAMPQGELGTLTRAMCDRHRGIGGDGVIFYETTTAGAAMTLFNADGSASELSGNGLRCLAAQVARARGLSAGAVIRIETDAGIKTLELLQIVSTRYSFRAALGPPTGLREAMIRVDGEAIKASVLGMGNPQCVVLGPLPDTERFNRLGPALSTHAMFPEGTNVEFATVESPHRVRILIWERGVGPTTSSGTGTSAAAVAAAAHGGAARDIEVIAPGGTQRVEWREDGVYLTGWADIVAEGTWLGAASAEL